MRTLLRWQRHAYVTYTALFLLFFLVQTAVALALITLVVPLVGETTRYPLPYLILPVAIIALAFCLLLVNSVVLSVQAYHAGREELAARHEALWLKRWASVLFGDKPPPPGPLPAASVPALLDLKDSLSGEEAETALDLARYYAVEAGLVAQLGSRRRGLRLKALESLGKLRSAEALSLLLDAARDRHPAVRERALRAAARTVAALPDGPARDGAAGAVLAALKEAAPPLSAAEEVIVLLGAAARAPAAEILHGSASEGYLRLALDVVGRLGLSELAPDAARFINAPNPELRAAALKALVRLGLLPQEGRVALEAASRDERDFVRAQAARAVGLLPREEALGALHAALGDRSWWVRLAAAQTLLSLGEQGEELLEAAAAQHPDRYGRDAAAQALLDARLRRVREEAGAA